MWKSIQQIINSIENMNYVFLRNSEKIYDCVDGNDDWDILCDDISDLVKELRAIPLNKDKECFNFYTIVNGKKLLLDIRCVGDGYFDEAWEQEMLQTRKKVDHHFVLDEDHQKFSILYHCLVQKKNNSTLKYKEYILKQFGIYELDSNLKMLSSYLEDKKYSIKMPLDKGVYINNENIKRLEALMKWERK